MEFITLFDYFMSNNCNNVIFVESFDCGCKEEKNYRIEWENNYKHIEFNDLIKMNYGFYFTCEYQHEIINNTLYIYEERNCYCNNCRNIKIYCDEQPRPKGFDNLIMYHGLKAYCKRSELSEHETIIKNFESVYKHPEYQICCSTDTIGHIGIIVKGTILVASNKDLNTHIEEGTNRRYYYPTEKNRNNIIYDIKDLEENYIENNEFVINNTKAVAIWITNDASNELKALALKLSEKYNLPLIDVGKSTFA